MRHPLAATGSPIADEIRSTLLRQITEQGGFSYVTSAEQAAAGDIRAAEAACEMAWEQLHSGPWHEVVPAWRDAYAMSCLHVADLRVAAGDPREALRVLDMGLIMGGPLLRRDLDAAVKRIESGSGGGGDPRWEKKLSEVISVLPRRSLSCKAVEKRGELSMERFVCDYFLKGKPVVITGCIDHWPARTRWKDIEYLKRIAGERTVPVEVVGRKYIRLYPASVSEGLYPYSETMLCNSSQVDLDNLNTMEFPKAENLNFIDCVLEEGEMIYIPPKWWHYVRSLSMSFSVSFWWSASVFIPQST